MEVTYLDIMEAVTSRPVYSMRGAVIRITDTFLLHMASDAYLIAIIQTVSGENECYSYECCDCSTGKVLTESEWEQIGLSKWLPSLEKCTAQGEPFSLTERAAREEEIRKLVVDVVNYGMTDERMDMYRAAITALEPLKSPSFRPIYRWFLENIDLLS